MLKRARGAAGEMPFLDHLEELRWRILWSVLAVVTGAVLGFVLVQYAGIIEVLYRPFREQFGEELKLIYLGPTDAFFLTLRLAILVGIILAFPIIVYQVWSFLSPALEKREKRTIVPALYMGLVLFALGVAMSYYIALPVSLVFLAGFQTDIMEPTLEATRYFSFVIRLLVAFGIIFELPVVVMILSVLGLVTPAFLRSKRRHAVVLITVTASFLSPGDVIMVTVLMMVPLIVLYEFSILLSVMIYRKREEAQIGGDPPDGAVEAG